MSKPTYLFIFILIVFSAAADGNVLNMRSKTPDSIQAETVRNLIRRIVPEVADQFTVSINATLTPESGKDTVRIRKNDLTDGKIEITASNGVAAAWGFNHYLKYYCFCQIAWQTKQIQLPKTLPSIDKEITVQDLFRYYQNVVTTSYSFVWWNWQQWEQHIDWMALNGINMPLVFNGQETIMSRVFKKYYNLTEQDYNEHFTGPAFLAWNRMANVRGWAGPLSDNWHQSQLELGKQILDRMRSFGMQPVLPSFAGVVPRVFKDLYPEANIVPASQWLNFPEPYCQPYLVIPTDPLFAQIGKQFLNEIISEMGTDHLYSCDPFNEIVPDNGSDEFLHNYSAGIFKTMVDVDAQSVWILQNWFIVNNNDNFWSPPRVKAFLNGVPRSGLIILDLFSENSPQYEQTNNYYDHFYIWCMLHNFGGNLGMYGSFHIINKDVYEAREIENSTLIGTGLTPEGINQNYVLYDYMTEVSWRNEAVEEASWAGEYAQRRYGCEQFADVWARLIDTIYHYEGKNSGIYAINIRPTLTYDRDWWYDPYHFLDTWKMFLTADAGCLLDNNASYKYDVVDFTRQALQILGDLYYKNVTMAFANRDINEFRTEKENFLRIMTDMESILATDESFLLGRWLESAKSLGRTQNQYENQFEYNARNQITMWGPNGQIIDYANKQWAGIVGDYFQVRWKMFLNVAEDALVNETDFDEGEILVQIREKIEKPFSSDLKVYPTEPKGDTITIAHDILKFWWSNIEKNR